MVRGPGWNEVKDELAREQSLVDANRIDEWEELWAGLRARGLRLTLASGREGKLFALHVDDEELGRLRYIDE